MILRLRLSTKTIDKIDLPEVREFMEMFIPAFGMTLDQLSGEDTE